MANYALKITDNLYEEIKGVAKEHDSTVREVMVKLLKTGLIAMKAHDDENKELIFRETKNGETVEKEIFFL